MILPRSRIAIVDLTGTIGSGIKAAEYAGIFDQLRENKRVKAVILNINSPGGSATESGYLQASIAAVAKAKPVIAFVQGLAASGGYMAASAATKIIALPSSLVGSIGVISMTPILQGLLSRLGINMEVIKSGRLKDMGSLFRQPTEEERRKEQELSDEVYEDFIQTVSTNRKLDNANVKSIATGEVFTARKALQLGLIDEIGDHNKAIALASELGKVSKRFEYIRPRRGLLQRLTWGFASAMIDSITLRLEESLFWELRLQMKTERV